MKAGAKNFVEVANKQAKNRDKIICPHKVCQNQVCNSLKNVYEHLVINGMDASYTTWVLHGECLNVGMEHENTKKSKTFRMYI